MLDQTDIEILEALQEDARISNVALAARVHLSPTPCLRRLRKLEENGFIDGYTAVLNKAALGLNLSAYTFVKLARNTAAAAEELESAVKGFSEVVECCVVAGAHDYILRVVTRDLSAYEEFIKHKLAAVAGVTNIESTIIMSESKRQGWSFDRR